MTSTEVGQLEPYGGARAGGARCWCCGKHAAYIGIPTDYEALHYLGKGDPSLLRSCFQHVFKDKTLGVGMWFHSDDAGGRGQVKKWIEEQRRLAKEKELWFFPMFGGQPMKQRRPNSAPYEKPKMRVKIQVEIRNKGWSKVRVLTPDEADMVVETWVKHKSMKWEIIKNYRDRSDTNRQQAHIRAEECVEFLRCKCQAALGIDTIFDPYFVRSLRGCTKQHAHMDFDPHLQPEAASVIMALQTGTKIYVWGPGGGGEPRVVELDVGEAIVFASSLCHAGAEYPDNDNVRVFLTTHKYIGEKHNHNCPLLELGNEVDSKLPAYDVHLESLRSASRAGGTIEQGEIVRFGPDGWKSPFGVSRDPYKQD